jgi:hypothetical protein
MGPSHELLRQAGEAGGRATCSVIAQPPEGWWGKCGRGLLLVSPDYLEEAEQRRWSIPEPRYGQRVCEPFRQVNLDSSHYDSENSSTKTKPTQNPATRQLTNHISITAVSLSRHLGAVALSTSYQMIVTVGLAGHRSPVAVRMLTADAFWAGRGKEGRNA